MQSSLKENMKRLPGLKQLSDRFTGINLRIDGLNRRIDDLQKQMSGSSPRLAELMKTLASKGGFHDVVEQGTAQPAGGQDRIAVYTCIIGDYDSLRVPSVTDDLCDYYCITDNQALTSDFWRIIPVSRDDYLEKCRNDSTRINRYIKLHPHEFFPDYRYSVYLDANIEVRQSLVAWIKLFSTGKDMLLFSHPERDCIYEEALACKYFKYDDFSVIDRQMQRYRDEGFPEHAGMAWCGIMFRKLNPATESICDAWWRELENGSRRDQLSFSYVCWKHGFEYDVCPGGKYRLLFCETFSHKPSQNRQ